MDWLVTQSQALTRMRSKIRRRLAAPMLWWAEKKSEHQRRAEAEVAARSAAAQDAARAEEMAAQAMAMAKRAVQRIAPEAAKVALKLAEEAAADAVAAAERAAEKAAEKEAKTTAAEARVAAEASAAKAKEYVAEALKAVDEASKRERLQAETLDQYPAEPWPDNMRKVAGHILRRSLPQQRRTILRALRDIARYDMMQPPAAGQMQASPGVKARQEQWQAMQGGRKVGINVYLMAAFAIVGAAGGFVLGAGPGGQLIGIGTALIGAVLGGAAAFYVNIGAGFHDCMVLIIVNERRSRIRPEMVTAQARGYVPKALVLWRSHELRYGGGRPYLYVHIPHGVLLQSAVRGTLDCLLLPSDHYTAQDAAVYVQRSMNRQINDAALDHADMDDEVPRKDSWLGDHAHIVIPCLIVIAGILLVVMTST